MSDIPNKSKNRTAVNQVIDEDIGAFERIGRRSGARTAEDARDRATLQDASTTINGLESLIESDPSAGEVPSIARGLKQARESVKRLGPRVRLRRSMRYDRAVNASINTLERQFSSRAVNSIANDLSNTQGIQDASLSMMGMSSYDIEIERGNVMSSVNAMEKEAINIAQNRLFDKEGRPNDVAMSQIHNLHRNRGLAASRLAMLSAVERRQRHMGLDSESQMYDLMKAGSSAEGMLSYRQAQADRANGQGLGALSMGDLRKQEAEQANNLVSALKALTDGAQKSAEELESFKKQAKEASEGLEKTQEAIKAAAEAGGGGNRYNNFAALANPIGAAASQIFLNQPLQVRSNQVGFSNLANQAYETRKAGLGGSMADLMMATGGAYGSAQGVGDRYKWLSRVSTGIGVAANTASGIGGVVEAANGAKNAGVSLGLTGAGEMTQGVQQAVNGFAGAAVGISDLAQGASAGAYSLQAQGLSLQQDRANIHVTASMRQQLYNYTMGMRAASLQAGGSVGNSIIGATTDIGTLSKLQTARIGTEQFAQMAGDGAGAQGSVFGIDQVFAARNLERSGVADMGTSMSRMSRLAAAGGNNPQAGLQAVLEAAFSKSLDSSKALSAMVEHTATMAGASRGQMLGAFDTTAQSANLIAGMVDPNSKNREAALAAGASAAERLNSINSDVGTNYGSLVTVDAIARASGKSRATSTILKSLDDPTAYALAQETKKVSNMPNGKDRTQAEAELSEKLNTLSLSSFKNHSTQQIDLEGLQAGLQARATGILNQPGVAGRINRNAPGFKALMDGSVTSASGLDNKRFGSTLNEISEVGQSLGLTPDQFIKSFTGGNINGPSAVGISKADDAFKGKASGTRADLDDTATAKFVDMTKEARLAAEEFKGVANAVKAVRDATEQLANKLTDETAGEFRGAAADAAKNMSNAASTFTVGVSDFGRWVRTLRDGGGMPTIDGKEKR